MTKASLGVDAENLTGAELRLGYPTIIVAHALFNISLVLLLVRARLAGMDRTHVEASMDLYGTPWRTFWQITFPQLLPAIVAGALLSFTFSFDDYVITTFVAGAGNTTLPLFTRVRPIPQSCRPALSRCVNQSSHGSTTRTDRIFHLAKCRAMDCVVCTSATSR